MPQSSYVRDNENNKSSGSEAPDPLLRLNGLPSGETPCTPGKPNIPKPLIRVSCRTYGFLKGMIKNKASHGTKALVCCPAIIKFLIDIYA
jgi:hypothetical protein